MSLQNYETPGRDSAGKSDDLLSGIVDRFKNVYSISLNDIQQQCIKEVVINRKHLFATLPTGFGKTMIFVGALMGEKLNKRGTVSILVVPILALLEEHLETLKEFKIRAINLQDKSQRDSLSDGPDNAPTVVVTFPETLFSPEGNDFVESVAEKIIYFAIDEVHLLYFWGDITGSESKDVFRATFTKMRDLFVKFTVEPILINLTATLTLASTRKIMKHLAINSKNTFMVNKEPIGNKTNIIVMEQGTAFSIEALFLYFHDKLDDQRIIIFCRSLVDCGALHRDITHAFGDKFGDIVRVLTAETDKDTKDEIIKDLQNKDGNDGKIKLMIATSTLSMGVNIKGAKYVIQLGMPTSFEEYVQKCGRCGRKDVGYAVIYPQFVRIHPKTNDKFREFCRLENEGCLKKLIDEHFRDYSADERLENNCGSCSRCQPNSNNTFVELLKTYKSEDPKDDSKKKIRTLAEDTKKLVQKLFDEELIFLTKRHYQKDFFGIPALGYSVLTTTCRELIVKRLEYIENDSDLSDIVASSEVRRQVLFLVYDFFRDIQLPNPDHCNSLCFERPQLPIADFGIYSSNDGYTENVDDYLGDIP